MKRILVPVDFSKYSEYALEVAAAIAKKETAEIVVVHMMGFKDSLLTRDQSRELINGLNYMQLTKEKFQKFLNKDYLENIVVHDTIRNYKVFSELNEVAKEWKAEFIVMGSHGLTGVKDAVVGSNTEKVVRTSDIPVLVVKKQLKNFKISQAVFVTNFDSKFIPSYQEAQKFLRYFSCDPKLLYVNLPEKFMSTLEMEAKSAKFLTEAGITNPAILEKVTYYCDYTLESGIDHYCEERDIDLIILPTHGRKGLSHFFYGSVGENVANNARIPVLTMKIKEED